MPENNSELFVGLVIGTTKIVMIAAEKDSDSQNSLHFVGFGSAPSRGVNKGVIVSVTDAAASIRRAFNELSDITGIPPERLRNVIAAFNAPDVVNESVSATLEFSEPQTITRDTLKTAAQKVSSSLKGNSTMFTVHMFPEKYTLDDAGTDNPFGKIWTHLADRVEDISTLTREKLAEKISGKTIVLSGGVSLMQGIDTMLEDFMHVPVRKAKEPLLSMPVGMNTAEFVSEAGTLKYFAEEKSCL